MSPSLTGRASRRAALLLLLAACVHDVHRVGPIAVPRGERPPSVRILLFGDYGLESPQRWLVTRGMRRAHAASPFDLAVQLGDNLYYCGPDPTRETAAACRFAEDNASLAPGVPPSDDPLFRIAEEPLEGLLGRDGRPIPMYLAIGNHDVGWGSRCSAKGLSAEEASRRRACVAVARRTDAWLMPARHYVVDRGPVRVVVVDSNVIVRDYGGFTLDEELAFVRDATRGCGTERPFCFIAGHHPPAAAHGYGRPGRRGWSPFPGRMARLLGAAEGRVHGWFGGHVHTLEHLSLDGMEVFVSGSTAMGAFRPFTVRRPPRAQLRFATTEWGYTVLEADARGYRVEFRAHDGLPLHCCESDGGPCRPVHCPS